MPSLNFYQYPGTGEYNFYSGSLIHPEIWGNWVLVWQGPVLPYSDLHWSQYTGFYIPWGVLQGEHIGFLWPIPDDATIYAGKFQTKISGDIGNRLNDGEYFNVSFRGEVNPLIYDPSGLLSVKYSGEIASGLNQYSNLQLHFTGNINTGNKDVSLFNLSFSGNHVSGFNETAFASYKLSGELVNTAKENSFLRMNFSGELVKGNRDIVNVDCYLYSGGYRIGGVALYSSSGDNMSIDFNFIGLEYRSEL